MLGWNDVISDDKVEMRVLKVYDDEPSSAVIWGIEPW